MANVVYIAGKMRGLIDMGREHFRQAEVFLKKMGYTVMNPARLPENMPAESYMPICLAMLREADAIGLLPDWQDSIGAQIELQYARETGKKVYFLERDFAFVYDDTSNSDARLFEDVLMLTKEIVDDELRKSFSNELAEEMTEYIMDGMIENTGDYMNHFRDWREGTK